MESKETKEVRHYLDFGEFTLSGYTHDKGAVFIGTKKIDPITAESSTSHRCYEVRITYATEENGKHTAVGYVDGTPVFELSTSFGKAKIRHMAIGALYSFYKHSKKHGGRNRGKGKENDNGNS